MKDIELILREDALKITQGYARIWTSIWKIPAVPLDATKHLTDRIKELEEKKRELVLQSLADSGQAQEAYAEVVRLKEGIQKAIALAKKPYYGYLEDRIDNYYEGFLILEELLKK